MPVQENYLSGGIKVRYYYSGINKLVKAEIDTDFDGKLDKAYLPILDGRGTLIGVAEGKGPIDNPTSWVLIEKLYYNSTGLMKSFTRRGKNGKFKPTLNKFRQNIARSKYLPFGWTGMYKDRFTGLYHTHFREYDPIHGRWLSQDPAGYRDGYNLYAAYMGVNGVDALGLGWQDKEWSDTSMVISAYYMRFQGSKNKWKEADYPNAINLLKWAQSEGWKFKEATYLFSRYSIDYTKRIIYISHGYFGTVTPARATNYLYAALSEAYHQEKVLPKKVINYTAKQSGSKWYNSGVGWLYYDELFNIVGITRVSYSMAGGDAYGNNWTSKQRRYNLIIGLIQSGLFIAPIAKAGIAGTKAMANRTLARSEPLVIQNYPYFATWKDFKAVFNKKVVLRKTARKMWKMYQKNPEKFFQYSIVEKTLYKNGFYKLNISTYDRASYQLFQFFYGTTGASKAFRTSLGTLESIFSTTPPYPTCNSDFWYYVGYTGGIYITTEILDE